MPRILPFLVVLPLAFGCKKKAEPPAPAPTVTAPAPAGPAAKPLSWREGIKSSDPNARAEALQAIDPSEIGAPPPELTAALGDASPVVRKAAIGSALGFILQYSDSSALAKLLELAEKETDEEVRAAAVRALSATSHRDVVPAFVRLFPSEKSPQIRDEMLAAFAKEADRRALPVLVRLLQEKDPSPLVFDALRRIDTTARPELLQLLESGSDEVRQRALRSLGEIGDTAAVPHLVKALRDKSPQTVVVAIDAVALIGPAEAVPTLLELCDHADAQVRARAIRALGNYRVPDAIPADQAFTKVASRLQSDAASEVRQEAARTLGQVGLKRSIPALRKVAGDRKAPGSLRAAAAAALGGIGDAAALPALTSALADKDDEVRTAAAKALGALRTPAAAQALTAAWARETHLDGRLAILEALGRVGGPDTAKLLLDVGQKDPVPLVRIEAGGALLRLGRTEGLGILRPILTGSKDWEERRAAARALEKRSWRERRAAAKTEPGQKLSAVVTSLIVEALGTEKEHLVREVLFRQLGRSDGPAAAAEQRKLVGEQVPFFRLMVASGLCRNGDAGGCKVLVEGLERPEAVVRFEAARRIGWYRLKGAEDGLKKVVEDPVVFVANAARQALARLETPAAP